MVPDTAENSPEDLRKRHEATMWACHENPWSGWTRVPAGPALILVIYRNTRRVPRGLTPRVKPTRGFTFTVPGDD
jgi:hypothetical protein